MLTFFLASTACVLVVMLARPAYALVRGRGR